MIAALQESTMRHVVPQTGGAGLTDLEKIDGNYSTAGEADVLWPS